MRLQKTIFYTRIAFIDGKRWYTYMYAIGIWYDIYFYISSFQRKYRHLRETEGRLRSLQWRALEKNLSYNIGFEFQLVY